MLCSDSQQPNHLVRSWAGIPKYFFVFISLGGSRGRFQVGGEYTEGKALFLKDRIGI